MPAIPLANVANAHKVRRVIANGRVYEMGQLLERAPSARTTSVQAPIQSQRCLGDGGLGRNQQGERVQIE